MELSKSAKALLLEMIKDEPDTYTKLKYSLRLTGKYTHSLYDMLKEFENTGWRKDLVTDLREKLCVPDSYNYGRFKKNVLVDSMDEINRKTDITVFFTEHKKTTGRKGRKSIERIDWKILKKEIPSVTDMTEESWAESLLQFLGNKVSIRHDEAIAIVHRARENGLSRVQMKNRISVVPGSPDVKNFVGFCVWAMGREFRTPAQVKQRFQYLTGPVQRKYSGEWYRLLEKSMLCPERMTPEEKKQYRLLCALKST